MKLTSRGFSLLETLVTVSVMSVAWLALTKLNSTGMKANKSSSIRLDLMDTKRTISGRLSCEKTLGTAAASCTGDQVLKDKSGNPILNNGKIGGWTIRATCEAIGSAGNGLSIRASKTIDGSNPITYVIEPLNNLALNESHPLSMLYAPEVRPCAESFSNVAAEPPLIPYGGIMLWAGTYATIPAGWALCDGNNGTPDLRNRFVVGAGWNYGPYATGGTAHAVVVAHSHLPGIPPTTGGGFSTSNPNGATTGNFALTNSLNTNSPGNGQGYVSTTTSTEGVSGTNMNLPPYFSLAYIMRIK